MLAAVGGVVVQSVLLIVASIPFGLTITWQAALVVIGLLWLRSEDAYAPLVFTVTLPLLLLSGVLLPLTLAPDWLRRIAAFNPLAYAVPAASAAPSPRKREKKDSVRRHASSDAAAS